MDNAIILGVSAAWVAGGALYWAGFNYRHISQQKLGAVTEQWTSVLGKLANQEKANNDLGKQLEAQLERNKTLLHDSQLAATYTEDIESQLMSERTKTGELEQLLQTERQRFKLTVADHAKALTAVADAQRKSDKERRDLVKQLGRAKQIIAGEHRQAFKDGQLCVMEDLQLKCRSLYSGKSTWDIIERFLRRYTLEFLTNKEDNGNDVHGEGAGEAQAAGL